MKTIKRVALLVVLLGVSSGSFASETSDYRLPPGVKPLSQSIELHLDPSQANYSGSTSIRLKVDEPINRIGVHQVDLSFSRIELHSIRGKRIFQAETGEWGISWLSDGGPIAPGEYTLSIQFSGVYPTDALGMYRVAYEQNDYIFTQMESMYARRAFPTFDEPSFKIPFHLVINAPEQLTVIANTPTAELVEKDGWQRVTFEPTPPLSSYMIAYAVGPLDRAAIEGLSVPGHIYVPKGHTRKLGFVLQETPKIVAALEDYFGSKYPYRKLDFVAAPGLAISAMENPGLITFRTDLLLVGDKISGEKAVNVLDLIAHEVAHIWYGDLVTMAWWDDLWLNEAFATWMAGKVLETEYPQYETFLQLPQLYALAVDQATTSRAIRATVRDEHEITENLDLNYAKGHALLTMLERYVGSEAWQTSIRAYVKKFAWGNATEADLWAVISEESGLDVTNIAGDYLNQPGFASVHIGETGRVTQERYVQQGLHAQEQLWRIPMNVKYKAEGKVRQTHLLLEGRTGDLDLPANVDWIFPDAGGEGYYRWVTSIEHFYNLLKDIDQLSEREKIALLDNSEAMLNTGSISMIDYLSVVNQLLGDPHPLVFLPALEKIKLIGRQFVNETNRSAYAKFIDRSLSDRYRDIGIRGRADDSEATLQMRPRLVRTLGQFGTNEALLTEASSLVETYFKSPADVQSQMALEAMRITALHNDGSLYERYIDAYLKSESADQKSNILSAMYFDEPEVVLRHLEFSLSDDVQVGNSFKALMFFAYVLEDHELLYEWLEGHYEEFVAKVPSFLWPWIPAWVSGSCNQANLDMLTDFFEDRGKVFASNLGEIVEAETACIARRDRHADEFDEFLERYLEAP